jgi:ribonucleoside-diphosphate reductase alpha chain
MSQITAPKITENALKILQKRYLWKFDDGSQETPLDMFKRVARDNVRAERLEERAQYERIFLEMMSDLRFMPNTPTLTNAGREKGLLVACLVLPISDSMEGIMDCLKAQALVQKSGSGCGFSFGCIRERGALIKSTGMHAVGPIPVIKLMNYMMTEFIMQGGIRLGANLGTLPINHPDIEEFITFKKVDGSCSSFNISPAVTDKFMEAVEADLSWDLLSRVDGSVKKTVRARDLFDLITTSAWETGDPGLLFVDAANRANPTPHIGIYEATNACGEQWLLPNEGCTLGHLVLSKYFIKHPKSNGTWQSHFDWNQFKTDIHFGVRFLDNVVETSYYPLPEIEQMHKNTNRKIGLGVMGLADLLIMLNVPYASNDARDIANQIGAFLREHADGASCALGEERGSFAAFKGSKLQDDGWEYMRNACRITVAPTGSTSIIVDASPSIEPGFGFILERNQGGMIMHETHPLLAAYLNTVPVETKEEILRYYSENKTFKHCPDMLDDMQDIFAQANDISYADHIKMQAVWQHHVDSSISKTVNLPSDATVDDVKNAYMMAWELGCKGVTIYRDGCRMNQPLSASAKTTSKPVVQNPCPECGTEMHMTSGCESCPSCGYGKCSMPGSTSIQPTPATL